MRKILIVDDSSPIRKVVAAKVEKMGLIVAGFAGDGEEGIEEFRRLKPDLVLLDITMPNMDGRRCLEELKRIDPACRVIMLSALNCKEIEAECIARGALSFVQKSQMLACNEFEQKVREALGISVAALAA